MHERAETSLDLPSFFAQVAEGVGPCADLPDGVAVSFDLRGEGGGSWTVRRRGEGFQVLRSQVARPDCRLSCTVEDFQALLEGHLGSRRGFLEGRLQVEGDVGLILRLERALARTGER